MIDSALLPLQELNSFFIKSIEDLVKQFTSLEVSDQQVPTLPDNTHPQFYIQEITEPEVIDIISALNNSKAKDIYGLDTSFLKSHKKALAPPIMHLVNLSIKNAVFPKAWKLASVTPVFKAGDKSDINNYRPISILPITSKIIEKLKNKLLNSSVIAKLLYIPCSLGFGHTTQPRLH